MIKRNGDNASCVAAGKVCEARGAPLAGTRIPRAAHTHRMTPPDAHHKEASVALSTYVEKWKNRYEDAERRHKACLLKAEKAKREHDDLQRRHRILEEEKRHLLGELQDRERELGRLKHVSEKLFQEYQQLKNQHEVDSGVMQKVMQQAGEWYQQNRQLKRRSAALLQALPTLTDIDFTDSNDAASDASSNEEVEFLKQTVRELSARLAALHTELGTVRLHEFEAHEAHAARAQELEECRARCSQQAAELAGARAALDRHTALAKLLLDQLAALKDNADQDRHMAETYKSEARAAKKRATVLAHQSSLLLGELAADERAAMLLAEVEQLRDALEDQAARHRDAIEDLQLQLAEKHEDTDILLWEEKISLAEEDAQKATERAERAERRVSDAERRAADAERRLDELERRRAASEPLVGTDVKLHPEIKTTQVEVKMPVEKKFEATCASIPRPPKKSNLMSRISYFENGAAVKEQREEKVEQIKEEEVLQVEQVSEVAAPAPVPPPAPAAPAPPASTAPPPPPPPPCCPPPPPPPPPPPAVFTGAAGDMASMLASKQGTLKRTKQNGEAGGGAIDAIVDQIKGGKFQLKATEQSFLDRKKDEAPPEAVREMLAILGTLRKRRPAPRADQL